MKYTTSTIDYTGCHPVIAEHLKRGEAIECLVWDKPIKAGFSRFVDGYNARKRFAYHCDDILCSNWECAEPIPRKVRRIMPPERAIPVLIAEGYKFSVDGRLVGPEQTLVSPMFWCMGKLINDPAAIPWIWPPCIIEECDE